LSRLGASRPTTYQHSAPFENPPGAPEEVEVTDPTHPLFGRRFHVVSISHPPRRPGQVTVTYRDGMCLRFPVLATNLAPGNAAALRSKFTREALLDLVALVKECEVACPDHPGASGPDLPTT
jgi:hypothetical protein